MLAEWLMKEEIKQAREEGYAEGYAEGHAEGYAEGRAEGYAEGRAEGYAEGRAEVRKLALEAAKQRREGETLEQAIARLETEKPNRR